MKYFITYILLSLSLPIFASNELDKALDILDRKISERYAYEIDKNRNINSLKFELDNSSDTLKRIDINQALFSEYKTYQYDSAYYYAIQMRQLAIEINDTNAIAQSYCNLLYCYSTAGFFKEGAEVIDNFPETGISSEIMSNFYKGCIRHYFNLMRYVGDSEELHKSYRNEIVQYTALALNTLAEGSFGYRFVDVQSDIMLGLNNKESIEKIKELLNTPNLSLNNKAIMYSWLGIAYQMEGYTDSAIYYTALSTIADIESCTYETTSAKDLAVYMYERNDITRAAKYIRIALDDANTYNSPYRKLEVQSILPEIIDQYLYLIRQDTLLWAIISGVIILLLIVIIFMLTKIHRRNVALRSARARIERHANELSIMNDKLSELTAKLSEANKIKDRYIIESLYSDSVFVESVEKMCKVLIRKIKAKQYTELLDLISSISIKRERQRMSSTFDSAFLKLFPNFITEYNKLFDAENAVVLNESEELTPEIRIFALIRLGVEDINLISGYLSLSPNTIYVYKAKVKARTIVPKDEFEEYIKAILQPY